MRNRMLTGVVASLAILGSSVTVLLSLYELPPSVNSRPFEALGWSLAQTAQSLFNEGGQITIVTRDTSAFKQPALDVAFRSFQKALGKPRARQAAIVALQVDPLRPVEVPRGDFFEMIRRAPKGSVIVSFLGPPRLSAEQRGQLGEIKPKIIALCLGNPAQIGLSTLFEQHLLHAAVVNRPNQSTLPAQPKSLSGWFEQSYLLVTAANLDGLPRSGGSAR